MNLRINWTAISVAVCSLSMVTKVSSANDANGEPEGCCPPPTTWELVSCPGLANTPSITPLDFCATAGDSVCMPDIVLPIYSEGQKKRTRYAACECVPNNETAAITFTPEFKWERSLPDKLTATFVSTLYAYVTSSDLGLCPPPSRLALGTVTWTVNPKPTEVNEVNWLQQGSISETWPDCTMGQTQLCSPLGNSSRLDIGVYANCGSDIWKVKLTRFDAQILQRVRLLVGPPPMTELTSNIVANTTDCGYLTQMRDNLTSLANTVAPGLGSASCDTTISRYWVLAAVQAHEDVHKEHYKHLVGVAFSEFKATVEALTTPRTNCDQAGGKAQILAKVEYLAAVQALTTALVAAVVAESEHVNTTNYSDAQHQVVDDLIQQVRDRMTTLQCP